MCKTGCLLNGCDSRTSACLPHLVVVVSSAGVVPSAEGVVPSAEGVVPSAEGADKHVAQTDSAWTRISSRMSSEVVSRPPYSDLRLSGYCSPGLRVMRVL